MGNEIQFNPNLQKKRWVGYFDLLGIKSLFKPENQLPLIKSLAESPTFKNKKNYFAPFSAISTAIEETKRRVGAWKNVKYIWFSDTFIVYTDYAGKGSFCAINNISRWFVYNLIIKGDGIPIRGAISCDDFYVDRKNKLFFGEALIEAYKYGEAQDWIGFILCPSAEEQFKHLGMKAENFTDYAYTYIPLKKGQSNLDSVHNKKLLAFVMKNFGYIPIIKKLKQMRERIDDKNIRSKYDRTIEFNEKQ
jgi:hypothetical protein